MSGACTFPTCPTCDGKGWIWSEKTVRYKKHRHQKPCEDCNGSGYVSPVRFDCIMKKSDGDTMELECRIKVDDD